MAWIETVPEDEARDDLAALYAENRDPATGAVDNILKIHSLSPPGLAAHVALYRHAMKGTATLPEVDRELIALVVSKVNGCHY